MPRGSMLPQLPDSVGAESITAVLTGVPTRSLQVTFPLFASMA